MRNYSIDILKFIFALIIVIGHGDIPNAPKYLVPVRFALFCFFMISGYLIEKSDPDKTNISIKRNIQHLVKVLFYCFLFFFPIYVFIDVYIDHTPLFSEFSILNICLFNETPFWMHLWYLSAYLYVLIFMYFFNKIPYRNTLLLFLPLLLIGGLLFGPYSDLILGRNFEIITYRNAWFMGIPSFCIGAIVKRTQIHKKISDKALLFLLIITWLLPYFEAREIVHNYYKEFYFSNIIFAFFLLLAALKHPLSKPNFLSKMGEEFALELYIIHPIFIYFIRHYIRLYYGREALIAYFHIEAPVVIILSLTVLFIWHKTIERFKAKSI